jgi:hypothetical protein
MLCVSTLISRLSVGMLSMSLVAGCASYSTSTGEGNPHVAEAITHAQEAVNHGGMGHADAVVTHAEVSLQQAQAAEKFFRGTLEQIEKQILQQQTWALN